MPGGNLTKEQFLKFVRNGIKRVESDNRYNLINDKRQNGNSPTYALGAYQFVPSHHWNDIVDFAKKDPRFKNIYAWKITSGNFKSPEAIKQYERFLNNPALQDAFMDHYAGSKYNKAKQLYNQYGQKYNLRIDEIYSMMHHQGDEGASEALKNGQVNYKSVDGTGGSTYQKKYNRGVNDAFGVPKDKKGNYVGTKSQRNEFLYDRASGKNSYSDPTKVKINESKDYTDYKEYKEGFKQAQNRLKTNFITEEQYNNEINNLQKKFEKRGTINDINQWISKENRDLKQKKWAQAEKAGNLVNIFNKATFSTTYYDGKNRIHNPSSVYIEKSRLNAEELKFIKNNPELFNSDNKSIFNSIKNLKNGEKVIQIKDIYDYSKKMSSLQKEFGVNFNAVYKKDGVIYLNSQLKTRDNIGSNGAGEWIGNKLMPGVQNRGYLGNSINRISYDSSAIGTGLPFLSSSNNEDYSSNNEDYTEPLLDNTGTPINDGYYNPSSSSNPIQTTSGNSTPNIETESPISANNNSKEAIEKYIEYETKKKAEQEQDEERDLNKLALDNIWNYPVASGYDPGYSPDQYKNDVPLKDLANSLGGILVGQDMADTKIPERDEKVSAAYQSYISEMAEISKRGLSVEDESAAKQKISESYSLGVQALERASGGNRNVVLGNLGGLDAQRSQNLLNLSVEDAKMKMEGLQAYGEGVKYINEFDANRDIANNEREYSIAQERRRNGNDLTAAAGTNFSQTMSNYDNNKPGSVNHAMKTQFLRNAFQYDPNLKDDGTGNTKYTWSWRQKENEKSALLSTQGESLKSRMNGMNEDELNVLGKHLRQTASSDLDASVRLADYLISNRNKEGFDIKSINDPLAYYNNVFKTESPNKDFSSPIDVNTYTEGIQKSSSEFFKENPSSWENIYDKNSYHSDVNKGIPNFTENKKGIDFDSILNMANGLTTPKYNV